MIWSIDALLSIPALQQEVQQLQERWQPAPLPLLLPDPVTSSRDQLLALGAEGLLQNGDLAALASAIDTLLSGGRVADSVVRRPPPQPQPRPWVWASGCW